jgi:hypothetical protein
MTYPRFIVLMGLRTHGGVLLVAAVVAGFASVQLPAMTKAAPRGKVAENGIFQCHPEPQGGCISIRTGSGCVAHPRCQWAKDDGGDYCRPIDCWI